MVNQLVVHYKDLEQDSRRYKLRIRSYNDIDIYLVKDEDSKQHDPTFYSLIDKARDEYLKRQIPYTLIGKWLPGTSKMVMFRQTHHNGVSKAFAAYAVEV
jgi:hypothetical protein